MSRAGNSLFVSHRSPRKPPQFARTARAKLAVFLPPRPLTDYFEEVAYGLKPMGKIGYCLFEVFRDSCQGTVENARGRLYQCDFDRPKDAFRRIWRYLREERIAPATLMLSFQPSVGVRLRELARRAYVWFLRQCQKHAYQAA